MFSRILVPVELSEKDALAVRVLRDLAPAGGAEVTLLHVIETLDLPYEELEDFYARLEARATTALDGLSRSLAEAGLDVVQRVAFGTRVAEILAYAEETDADLIVVVARAVDPERPAAAWSGIAHQVAVLSRRSVLLLRS